MNIKKFKNIKNINMDSSKQALVHMAAAIKVICPQMKTMGSMRIVKFKDEDINHASSSVWIKNTLQMETRKECTPERLTEI